MNADVKRALDQGVVIPAMPLALDAARRFDARRQRALCRYYAAAGAGGLAVGVHTTQFAIREPRHNLFETVLSLAAQVIDELDAGLEGARAVPLIRIGGICGRTPQATAEAELLAGLGYHAGLINLGALSSDSIDALIAHCRAVAQVIPLFGFYLGTAVGGRVLPYDFWRRFAEIDRVVAIKVASFNRYQTLDCVRAIAESGRRDIALYTGNDDNIVSDLATPFQFRVGGDAVQRRFVGGLLGHWAFWTRHAVQLLASCQRAARDQDHALASNLLAAACQVTDANAAVFDAAHGFAGCIPGINSILARQGLLAGDWCLDEREVLSPGQADEIDRVRASYPHFADDAFVAERLDRWLD